MRFERPGRIEKGPLYLKENVALTPTRFRTIAFFNESDFAPGIYSVRVTDIAWVQAVTKLVRIAH